MKIHSKRIISLILAGVMTCSSFTNFSITSFASTESGTENNEISVINETEETTLVNTENETESETDEATPTDANEEEPDLIEFDHYYSDIDESLVETTDLIVTTSDSGIFTKNTNVISNYDNAYIISCDTVEEAKYVYSYYVDKVDTISDLSKSISISTEDTEEDVADLSDLNNDTDVLSTLNDINAGNYSGYIALIDTGADADVNFSVIGDDTSDTNGHGTKMLNLIKENNPDAKVLSIKVSEGSKTDAASIYAGIMLAIESKVSVINLSMVGYDTESNAIVKEAIEEAIASGITVIGAAGNYNLSAKKFIPGSIDDAIIVGAANEDGTKYSKSNYDADLYVVATSTSEATAIYTGLYTAEKLDDERIYTSLVTETADEEDDEDTTETEVSEEAEEIALNTVNSVKELLENSGDDSFELEYEINDDGSVSITYVSTDFETAMDSTASGLIKDCGTVSYDLFSTKTTGTTVETGTCTIASNSTGISTASNFSATSSSTMFSDILKAAGVSSIGVCCERHWENETNSAHATTLSGSGIKYKAVLTNYTTSNGKATATIDLYFTNDNYSDRSWTSHSAAFAWSISMSEITGTSTYTVAASVSYNGSSIYSYTGTTNGSEIDNMVTVVQGEINSAMSEVSTAAAKDYGGVRWADPMTTGTAPYYSWNSTAASTVTYHWYSTAQDQIYRGRITATAPMYTYLTLTKKTSDSGSSFIEYCESIGLDYYSLNGTKFIVYTDKNCTNVLKDVNEKEVTFTVSSSSDTDDDGNPCKTFTLDADWAGQTVYIKETGVGTGYKYNSSYISGKSYTLPDAGKTKEVTIANTPMYDPLNLQLVKISDAGGTNTDWSGETSPLGATYTITGYTLGSNNTKGSKFYTWTAETDENGIIDFDKQNYYTSGDTYTNSSGVVIFPIGYYTIKETAVEPSSGTKINSRTYTLIIYPSSDNTDVKVVLYDGTPDSGTEIYSTDNSVNPDYKITLADGTTVTGVSYSSSGNIILRTLEEEEWAYLGLFKTDEAYIENGYLSNDEVLKTSNAGTSFDGAVFNIYVDSSKVKDFSTSTFFGSHNEDGNVYTLKSVSSIVVSDYLGNSETISVSGLYQIYVNGNPLTITTNATGSGKTEYKLPKSDGYVAYEVNAPEGFVYNTERITFDKDNWVLETALETVTAPDGTTIQKATQKGSYYYADIIAADNSTKTGMVVETDYYYGIKFTKEDTENDTEQGDANLNGIQFAVVNRTGSTVLLSDEYVTANLSNVEYSNGTLIKNGGIVAIVTTNTIDGKDGVFYINGLPYGEYEVYELRADNTLSVGDIYNSSSSKYGTSVYATKYPELNTNTDTSSYPSMTFEALDLSFTLNSSTNGYIYTTDIDNTDISNEVVRGGFTVKKYDEETQSGTPLGGANLAGTFQIVNKSKTTVVVDTNQNGVYEASEYYKPGEVVFEFTTDKYTGEYTSPSDLLPYGTYEVIEIDPPEGYLMLSDTLLEDSLTFKVREEGVIVVEGETENENGDTSLIFYDYVCRGDIYFVKKNDDGETMAYIPFRLTSYDQDGNPIESHIIYTDSNGVYSSANSYVLHSYKTNYGDNATYNETTGYWESDCTGRVGTWFGVGTEVSDDLRLDETGALPYGMYTLEELPCEANKDYDLITTTFYISAEESDTNKTTDPNYYQYGKDAAYIDLGTLVDTETGTLTLETEALTQDTESHYASTKKDLVIVDTVSYSGLEPGETYYLETTIVSIKDLTSAVDVTGDESYAWTKFTTNAEGDGSGYVKVNIDMDATGLEGETYVVFEVLYNSNNEVVKFHKNINDENQQIHFAELTTELTDTKNGIHMLEASKGVSLTDTITYTNIESGKVYYINAWLMDADTGKKAVDDNGNEITYSGYFKTTGNNGSTEIVYEFDAETLAGKTLVSYVEITRNGNAVAEHKDLTDNNQAVAFPEIGTTLTSTATSDHVAKAEEEVTLTDTVKYTNLIEGKEYTITGTLMVKSTGKVLVDSEGNAITSTKVFTAGDSDVSDDEINFVSGTVTLEFTFDASLLAGTSTVAFETITYNGKEVAVHADIDDEGQTVDFPKVGTTLTDSETLDHIANPDESVSLIDTVAYENLTVGKEYTVSGILMDKSTGEELLDASGNTVTASETFVAESKNGTIDIEFTFDASLLAGTSTVAFETITYNGKEVAVHADIDDEGQTVDFPSIHTTARDKNTGTHEGTVSTTCTIIDTVTYTNLVVGKNYTVKGTLMNKATGKELLDANGNPVTAELTFLAETSSGTVDMEFTFDSSLLAGASAVVFETIYYEGIEVAVHNDLTDADQTIDFPGAPPKTGASIPVVPVTTGILAFALAGLGAILFKRRKTNR